MVVRGAPPLQYHALYRCSDLRCNVDRGLVAFRGAFPLSGNHWPCHHLLGHALSCWCWLRKHLLLSWTTERAAYSPAQRTRLSPSDLWSWRRFLTPPDLLSTCFEYASRASWTSRVHRRIRRTAYSPSHTVFCPRIHGRAKLELTAQPIDEPPRERTSERPASSGRAADPIGSGPHRFTPDQRCHLTSP